MKDRRNRPGAAQAAPTMLPLLAAFVVPAAAAAHETWILPEGHNFGTASSISFDLTSGEAFPALGTGPKAERIERIVVTVGRTAEGVTIGPEAPDSLKFTARVKPGLVVINAALKPHNIDLSSDKVAEYFDEADPPPGVRQAWQAAPEPRTWRETYVKNTKTLVCIRRCRQDRGAMTPFGANLEIVPLTPGPNPGRFKILARGLPLASQLVQAFDEHGLRLNLRSDYRGRVSRPKAKGWTMLSTVWLRPPVEAGGRFQSDFASIVFDADR